MHDVWLAQPLMTFQQLGDFQHRAVDDWIGNSGAEKSRLELARFRELLGPFAAGLRESEIGAR
jgi:hypothetical protein